jgi:chromate transporter
MDDDTQISQRLHSGAGVSFREALRLWAKVGFLSFGGPAGQIALMHRILVDEKRWIGEQRFLHALNYCMLLPGPEATQLATYVGWLLHRTLGGIVAGTLFVAPGFVVILALSVVYADFQEVTLVKAIFFGIKAAVLAVVIEAVLRIGRRALQSTPMYVIAALAFVGIFFLDIPFPLIVIAAGVAGLIAGRLDPERFIAGKGRRTDAAAGDAAVDRALAAGGLAHTRPSTARAIKIAAVCLALWFGPIALLAAAFGREHVFVEQALFFSKMAVVTFGGAYAVLAYVAQEAVDHFGWLAPGEMLDGLGMAETTPGPLILVLEFVGFMAAFRNPGGLDPMVAGVIGATLTTWVTFVPCFLWIFLGAPYVEAIRDNRMLGAALSAITAAVVGVILNLAVWFGLHVLFGTVEEVRVAVLKLHVPALATFDVASGVLALAALAAMLRFKAGMIPTLAACAAAGAAWFLAVR